MTRLGIMVAALFPTVALNAQPIQTKPDFSGTWLLQGNPRQLITSNGRTLPVGTPYGSKFTLKQDEKTLTITDPDGRMLLTVMLDGSPTKETQHDDTAGQDVEITWTAAWNGPRFVVTASWKSTQTTRTFLMQDGALLMEMQPTRNGPTATFTYKKSGLQ